MFVTCFTILVLWISFNLNTVFDSMNGFYLTFFKFKLAIQKVTSRVLFKFGLDQHKISADRFSFLGYDSLQNFSFYNQKDLGNLVNQFKDRFDEMIQITVASKLAVSTLLFDHKISSSLDFMREATQQKTDGVNLTTTENTIFEGLILNSFERISKLIWNIDSSTLLPFYLETPKNLISKGIVYIGQYFLIYDALNEQPLSTIEDTLAKTLQTTQTESVTILLVILLCFLFMSTILGCAQLLILRNLAKKIFKMFTSLHQISDLHFKSRLEQLDKVALIMKDIRERNYTIHEKHRRENVGSLVKRLKRGLLKKEGHLKSDKGTKAKSEEVIMNQGDNSRGRRIRYAKDSFYFNLFESYLAIGFQALTIIGYMVIIYLHFSGKIIKKQRLFSKEVDLNHISLQAAILQNYFYASYLFDSSQLLLQREKAIEGISSYYSSTASTWFDKVDNIFKSDDSDSFFIIKDFREKSSCQLVDQFKSPVTGAKTYCELGHLKILNQSLYLGLVGMYRNFLDTYTMTKNHKAVGELTAELNEPRNKEQEIYLNVLFYPTVDQMIGSIKQKFVDSLNNTDTSSLFLLILWIVLYVLLYSFFSVMAFRNLQQQIMVSRFAFQIFSLKAVLENNKIKARFMEFFSISNREFI